MIGRLKMARARVQLRHCETFTGLKGATWKKNQAREITKPSLIDYYKAHSEFVVTMLPDPKPKAKQEQPAPSSDESSGDAAPVKVSKAKLKRMSSPELVDFAAETFQLALDEDEMKKADLIEAIPEAIRW